LFSIELSDYGATTIYPWKVYYKFTFPSELLHLNVKRSLSTFETETQNLFMLLEQKLRKAFPSAFESFTLCGDVKSIHENLLEAKL